jgi:hypothetical protein
VAAQDQALLYGPFPQGGLTRGVSEGALLLDEAPSVRTLALARIAATGARVVRIPVDWHDLVDPDPPAGFQAQDPASPSYRFTSLDAAVVSAVSAGLTPLLVVSHAPAFAEAPDRWPFAYPGSWGPSPAALEAFASALARRYDGSFPDPLAAGRALPRVRLFQAWNEPNLARYLEPQWVVSEGRWSPFAALLYRQLLNAFYAGVKGVERSDVVAAAGLAPNGDPEGTGRTAPVRFLRALLCLAPTRAEGEDGPTPTRVDGGPRTTGARGRAADRRSGPVARIPCPDPAHLDVLAFHPLSVGSPDLPAASSQDVSIADAAKITSVLREAEREHTVLPAGHKPVWVTELNWESDPPVATGVPPRLQALWISRALHRLWVAGVSLVDWQFLVDPYPALRLGGPEGEGVEVARPAGLYRAGPGGDPAGASPKPFLRGFTFPFDPLRVDRRRVRLWALLSGPGQAVELQRGTPAGEWRTLARLRANARGVLNVLVPLVGAARLRLVSGPHVSAMATLPARRSSLR